MTLNPEGAGSGDRLPLEIRKNESMLVAPVAEGDFENAFSLYSLIFSLGALPPLSCRIIFGHFLFSNRFLKFHLVTEHFYSGRE